MTIYRIHVADISTFDEAFDVLGLRVGPRTGSDKRTQDDKEWWVVRRFLKAALLANVFTAPLTVWKEQPPMPDFGVEFADTPALIEKTEATHPDDQREMTKFDRSDKSAMLIGELGGRFSGGASSRGTLGRPTSSMQSNARRGSQSTQWPPKAGT